MHLFFLKQREHKSDVTVFYLKDLKRSTCVHSECTLPHFLAVYACFTLIFTILLRTSYFGYFGHSTKTSS